MLVVGYSSVVVGTSGVCHRSNCMGPEPTAHSDGESVNSTAPPSVSALNSKVDSTSRLPKGNELPPRIGAYRPLRLLGEGGMGVVYEAEQVRPRRVVALKVIRPILSSPQLLRRFEFEAEILGRLQHSGI